LANLPLEANVQFMTVMATKMQALAQWLSTCLFFCMKLGLQKCGLALLFLSSSIWAQTTAKQDAEQAGQSVKNAGKEAGSATAKTTKKAARKVKHGVKKAAHKTAQETQKGASKVEQKTQ
jgi:biopolymer transport protein ExbB/TolQ